LLVRWLDDVPDAGRNRGVLELLGPRDRGSRFMRSHRDREHEARRRHVMNHKLGRSVYLEKDTLVRMVRTVWPMHHKLPPASGPELEHLEGAGEPVWTPPTCQELWPSESLKDRFGLMREHPMTAKGGARSHDSPGLLTAIARRRPRTH